jgi:electron transfer flavoprotein alpha subunit
LTVLCLIEPDRDGGTDSSLRALSLAAGLVPAGEDLAAVVFLGPAAGLAAVLSPVPAADLDRVAAGLGRHGVADLYVIGPERVTGYAPAAWARSLAALVASTSASAVVAVATDRGGEVMAHLGAMTGLPVAANCVAASRCTPRSWQLVRHRWAGSLLEDSLLEATPALLTVAADAPAPTPVSPAGNGVPARVHRRQPTQRAEDLLVCAIESAAADGAVSLATARVVVGGGRGVGGPQGFAALEELARLLGGAVGVSMVVTSQGWRPHRQQVGQTGTRIAPELYLACGISGAIQHMAGCQSAKNIVAVNTDPDAPIMSRADYAVIGDLGEVIPALLAALRARVGAAAAAAAS